MLVIAVNHISDPDRLDALPAEWDVWTTTKSSIDTYGDIAKHAVAHGWGSEVVVVQDDIRGTFPMSDAELTVYGTRGEHVCQRAFRATPAIWEQLAYIWGLRTFQPCRAWQPLVAQYGELVNSIEHLEPVGARGGGNRVSVHR